MRDSTFVPVHGGCECGSIAYTVTAPSQELYHCHCSRCRRLHGALFATYAYVLRGDFQLLTGADNLSMYNSPLAQWYFCKTCGCHLFAKHDHHAEAMWYMPATLSADDVPWHPEDSEKHIFVASKSPIESISGDNPQYAEYAPPELSITARKPDSMG